MSIRLSAAILAAAWLVSGSAGTALAQSSVPLRGTLDGADAGTTADAAALPAAEPRLTVSPEEEPPPVRRKRQATADPYAQRGLSDGPLKLSPALEVGTVWSSNVNESDNNPQSDAGLLLRPSLKLESDWPRHALTAGVNGDLVFYKDRSDLDTKTLNANARLRLDIRRRTTGTAEGSYVLDRPANESSDEQTLTGSLGVAQEFGRITASLKGGAARKTYDGNSDRDYVQPNFTVRTSYSMSDELRPYIEGSYAPRYHDATPDSAGYSRDSIGYGLAAGLELGSGPIWTGDLGLTYLHRNYDDPRLEAADALGLQGNITWSPTELTRIVMSASTSIDEISSTTRGGAPVWQAGISATQSLRENIDLRAGTSFEYEDFGKTRDKTYEANLGVAWKFNPALSWTAGYDMTWLRSGTPGGSYVEHRLSTGLTVSP